MTQEIFTSAAIGALIGYLAGFLIGLCSRSEPYDEFHDHSDLS